MGSDENCKESRIYPMFKYAFGYGLFLIVFIIKLRHCGKPIRPITA